MNVKDIIKSDNFNLIEMYSKTKLTIEEYDNFVELLKDKYKYFSIKPKENILLEIELGMLHKRGTVLMLNVGLIKVETLVFFKSFKDLTRLNCYDYSDKFKWELEAMRHKFIIYDLEDDKQNECWSIIDSGDKSRISKMIKELDKL